MSNAGPVSNAGSASNAGPVRLSDCSLPKQRFFFASENCTAGFGAICTLGSSPGFCNPASNNGPNLRQSVPWYRQHLVIFQYLRFLQCLFRSVLISCDVWRRSGSRSRFRRRSLRRPFTVNYFINLGVLRNCQHFNISLTESSSKSMSLIRWLAVVLAYLVDSDLCHWWYPGPSWWYQPML